MEKETLWLPSGYGNNTIIFDKSGVPYQTVKNIGSGVNIWEIEKIDILQADQKIKSGYFSVLKANQE